MDSRYVEISKAKVVYIYSNLAGKLTPASAAPPTAASGGGAKPRNELEAFVMWLYFGTLSQDQESYL